MDAIFAGDRVAFTEVKREMKVQAVNAARATAEASPAVEAEK